MTRWTFIPVRTIYLVDAAFRLKLLAINWVGGHPVDRRPIHIDASSTHAARS